MPQNQQKGRKTGKDPVETSVPAPLPLNASLEVNLQEIGKRIGSSSDIVIRNFTNESLSSLSLTFIYIDGLVNADSVNQTVLQPLMENVTLKGDTITAEAAFSMIKDQMLPVGGVKEGKTLEVLLALLFEGYTLILFEGLQVALAADTSGWEKRSINEPTSQVSSAVRRRASRKVCARAPPCCAAGSKLPICGSKNIKSANVPRPESPSFI